MPVLHRFSPRRLATSCCLALVAALLAVAPFSATSASAADEVTVDILAVNDFHGRIADETTVQWAATVEQLRAESGDANTLFVGAGDLIGASLFESAIQDDQPTIDVFNALNLDASAVGNHEFDKGWIDLRDRVIGADDAPNAQWDYLGANVYHQGTTDPALPAFMLYDVGGLDVAVIGAVTEETPSLVSPAGIQELDFGNAADAVNREAAMLSDGVDTADNPEAELIVASFHAGADQGTGSDFATEYAKGGEFQQIADLDPAVDVITNGHTHQQYTYDAPIPGEPGTRPIIQTGEYAEFVGKVRVTATTDGEVLNYTQENVPRSTEDPDVLAAGNDTVAEVQRIVDDAIAKAAEVGNQPVGTITSDITRARIEGGNERGLESTLGDMVGNALVEGLPEDLRSEADLGMANPGGLRADLTYAGNTSTNPQNTDGVVTYGEANSVLPFLNNIWLVDLTGAQIKQILEEQWQPAGSDRAILHMGLSQNVRTILNPDAPKGERVTKVYIDGAEMDPGATYTVSTFSFLATGGDNFTTFTEGDARDTGLVDRDVWVNYLQTASPISPDFARQQVYADNWPTVTTGDDVRVEVDELDLTSDGSPDNTTLTVYLRDTGGNLTPVGDFPVSDGTAAISFTAPDIEGTQELVAYAEPTQTHLGPDGTVVATPPTLGCDASPQELQDAGFHVIRGGNGKDDLVGTDGDDAIFGGNGKDVIHAGAGNDLLCGGNGRDALYGEAGADALYGGNGKDTLVGGDGANTEEQ